MKDSIVDDIVDIYSYSQFPLSFPVSGITLQTSFLAKSSCRILQCYYSLNSCKECGPFSEIVNELWGSFMSICVKKCVK